MCLVATQTKFLPYCYYKRQVETRDKGSPTPLTTSQLDQYFLIFPFYWYNSLKIVLWKSNLNLRPNILRWSLKWCEKKNPNKMTSRYLWLLRVCSVSCRVWPYIIQSANSYLDTFVLLQPAWRLRVLRSAMFSNLWQIFFQTFEISTFYRILHLLL